MALLSSIIANSQDIYDQTTDKLPKCKQLTKRKFIFSVHKESLPALAPQVMHFESVRVNIYEGTKQKRTLTDKKSKIVLKS